MRIVDSSGARADFSLEPMTVADFYAETLAALAELDIAAAISRAPDEIPDAVPFDEDTVDASYDAARATRFHAVLRRADRACKNFRAE